MTHCIWTTSRFNSSCLSVARPCILLPEIVTDYRYMRTAQQCVFEHTSSNIVHSSITFPRWTDRESLVFRHGGTLCSHLGASGRLKFETHKHIHTRTKRTHTFCIIEQSQTQHARTHDTNDNEHAPKVRHARTIALGRLTTLARYVKRRMNT